MLLLMMVLGIAGAVLLLGGPALARLLVKRGDTRGLGRVLQLLGIALLVLALVLRPDSRDLREPPVSRTEGLTP